MRLIKLGLVGLLATAMIGAALPGSSAAVVKRKARYTSGQGLFPRNAPQAAEDQTGKAGLFGYIFDPVPGKAAFKVKVVDDVFGPEGIGVIVTFPNNEGQFGLCTNSKGIAKFNFPVPKDDQIRINVQVYETGVLWAGTSPCVNTAATGMLTLFYK